MATQYPELQSALEQWLKAALPLLREQIAHDPLETRNSMVWTPRLVSECFHPKSPIRALDETRQLGNAVAGMPEFADDAVTTPSWLTDSSLPAISASMKFGQFVFSYLGDDLDWSFDRPRFLRVYSDLETLIDTPECIKVMIRVEIWNVRAVFEEFEVAEGTVLRQLTQNERDRSIANSLTSQRFGVSGATPPVPGLWLEINRSFEEFLSRGLSSVNALPFRAGEHARAATRSLSLGLRLLTDADFGFGFYEVETDNRLVRVDGPIAFSIAREWKPRKPKKHRANWQRPRRRDFRDSAWDSIWQNVPRGPVVEIKAKTAAEIARLWPFLQRQTHADLETAFQRFELSFNRTDPEDRIIDYWIALESLFQDDKQELRRTASQRLAYFIEADRPQRFTIYSDARDSYDLRSKVVHGQIYDPAAVEDSAKMIHDYLRRALLLCFEFNSRPDLLALDNKMMFSARES